MIELVKLGIDIILHLDKYLGIIIENYGPWTYGILFAIVFLETGLVILPFLPGDSLLFVAGATAGIGLLNVNLLFVLLLAAAILGDTLNYSIGKRMGPKVFRDHSRWLNKEHLRRTQKFFDKYGTKAVLLARFLPLFRTVMPFLAGVGKMDYLKFLTYNVVGGFVWVSLFLFGGFFFGNLPFVEKHFSYIVLAIIIVSLIPAAVEYIKYKMEKKKK